MPLKLLNFESKGQVAALNRWADDVETAQKGTTNTIAFIGNTANTASAAIGPITGSQPANLVYASPNGSAGIPSFRSLVAADEPSTTVNAITNDTNVTGVITAQNLALGWTGTLSVARGGTGTSSPSLVDGTDITITGTWPNQTVSFSGSAGSPGGSNTDVQYNNSGAFGGSSALTWDGTTLLVGGIVEAQISGQGTLRLVPASGGNVFQSGDAAFSSGQSITFAGPGTTFIPVFNLSANEMVMVGTDGGLLFSLNDSGVNYFESGNAALSSAQNLTICGPGVSTITALTLTANVIVTGNITLDAELIDGSSSAGTSGYVLSSTGSATKWIAASGSPGGANTDIQYNNSSAFGGSSAFTVNTTNPQIIVTDSSGAINLGYVASGYLGIDMFGREILVSGVSDTNTYLVAANDLYLQSNSAVSAMNVFLDTAGLFHLISGTFSGSLALTAQFFDSLASAGTSGYVLSSTGSATKWIPAASGSPGGGSGDVQFNSSSTFGGSANLFWDSSNNRLGINCTPLKAFTVELASAASVGIDWDGFEPHLYSMDPTFSTYKAFIIDASTTVIADSGTAVVQQLHGGNLFVNNGLVVSTSIGTGSCGQGVVNAINGYEVNGTAGATAGPYTIITSITVVGGIITAISGS